MSNEAEVTLQTYFHDETRIQYFGDVQPVNYCLENILQGTWFSDDSPDLVSVFRDRCLIIEHFRFDCYKHTRKGSQNLEEQARIDRIAGTIKPTEEGAIYRDEITGESSFSLYVENVEKAFREHYRKIPQYRKNVLENKVISNSTELEVAFLIEDVSPLGTVAHDGIHLQTINLACCKPFLTLMRESPEVRYVIACSCYSNNYFTWLISHDQIDEFEKNSIEYASMQFISFTPKVMGAKIIIPSEESAQIEATEDRE